MEEEAKEALVAVLDGANLRARPPGAACQSERLLPRWLSWTPPDEAETPVRIFRVFIEAEMWREPVMPEPSYPDSVVSSSP